MQGLPLIKKTCVDDFHMRVGRSAVGLQFACSRLKKLRYLSIDLSRVLVLKSGHKDWSLCTNRSDVEVAAIAERDSKMSVQSPSISCLGRKIKHAGNHVQGPVRDPITRHKDVPNIAKLLEGPLI